MKWAAYFVWFVQNIPSINLLQGSPHKVMPVIQIAVVQLDMLLVLKL